MNKVDLGGYLYPSEIQECKKPTTLHQFRRNLYHAIQFSDSTSLGVDCEVVEERGKLHQPSSDVTVIAESIDRVFQTILVDLQKLPEQEQFEQLIKFRSAVSLFDKLLATSSCHTVDEKMEGPIFLKRTLDKIDRVVASLSFLNAQVANIRKLAQEFSEANPSDKIRLSKTIQTVLSVIHWQESFFQALQEDNLLAFCDYFETLKSRLIPSKVVGNILFTHMTEHRERYIDKNLQDSSFRFDQLQVPEEGFVMEDSKKAELIRGLSNLFGANIDLPTRLLLANCYYFDVHAGLIMSYANLSKRQQMTIITFLRQRLDEKDCDKRENIEKLLVMLLKDLCEKKSGASFQKSIQADSPTRKYSSNILTVLSSVTNGYPEEVASMARLREVVQNFRDFISDTAIDYRQGKIPKACTSFVEFPYRLLELEEAQRYHCLRPSFMEIYQALHGCLFNLQGLNAKQKIPLFSNQKLLPVELERLPDSSFFLSKTSIFPSEPKAATEERDLGFLPPQPIRRPDAPKKKKDRSLKLPQDQSVASPSKEPQADPIASSSSAPREKEAKPVQSPSTPKREALKIEYADRINVWFTNPDGILKTPEYRDLSPESQKRALMAHTFSKEVDQFIYSHGIHSQWKDEKRDHLDNRYSIPGQIVIDGNTFTGVFTYCFNSKGVCYHRHFKQKDNDALLMEYITKRKWEIDRDIEFPTLETSIMKQKAPLKTDGKKSVSIVEISPLVTELTFPDNNTVIRIFNIN